MNPKEPPQEPPAGKSSKDRWIKLAFLAVAACAAALVWWSYRKPPLQGWGKDMQAALQQAQADNRQVVALFINSPLSATDRWLIESIINKSANADALTEGRFIKVVQTCKLQSELAGRYRLKQLPSLLLLGPDGRELNRREGTVGEVEFRNGFLDCVNVFKP